jgi:hypothetical protein
LTGAVSVPSLLEVISTVAMGINQKEFNTAWRRLGHVDGQVAGGDRHSVEIPTDHECRR